MDIIRDIDLLHPARNRVVTIGNFDGVHLGHQKIFKKVVDKAAELGGASLAITFDPHPVRVLAPERGLKLITPFEDKAELVSLSGIETLLCLRFDREFAKTDPDDFIRHILVDRIGARWVIVGHNYSFGRAKKGTPELLRRRGRRYGFGVTVVRHAEIYGDIVSSSRVRSLILRGRVCEASKMLGRLYHIRGTVVAGAGRGLSILRTPTANLVTANELIPREGVYAVRVTFDSTGQGEESSGARPGGIVIPENPSSRVLDGVANLGKNPTFGGNMPSYEVHIFDFRDDLLGRRLRVHFVDRIREERRFADVRELGEQIARDKEKARALLARRTDPLYL